MSSLNREVSGVPDTRLPGIRFETVPARHPSILPRMDIPVFVGFASRGPLHVPVPITDAAEFSAVFGPAQVLAWDRERGQAGTAFLASAVSAFFQNGGRRCWVVRAADEYAAHTAHFAVPGLAEFDGSDLRPAYAAARSPGSWGDALSVSAALEAASLPLTAFDQVTAALDLTLSRPGEIVVGDLLRLNFDQDGWFALFPVSEIQIQPADPAPSLEKARAVTLLADRLFWFRPAQAQPPPAATGTMQIYTHNTSPALLAVTVPTGSWPTAADRAAVFDTDSALDPAARAACAQGSLVRITFPDSSVFWMLVSSQVSSDTQPSLPGVGEYERLSGPGVWYVPAAPDSTTFTDPSPRVEKLAFELMARTALDAPRRLSGLGFGTSHPRCWDCLPNDQQLFTTQANLTTGDASYGDLLTNPEYRSSTSTAAAGPHTGLWQEAASPRFPLGGRHLQRQFLPLLIPVLPTLTSGPDEPAGEALARDGLASFHAGLFLDPALAGLSGDNLLDSADAVRYLQASPRSLRGIHAALSVSEATLVAVPDAIHNQWEKGLLDPLPEAQPSPPPERPVWWRFLPCSPRPQQYPRTSQPEWGQFLRCGLRIIPAPTLSITQPDPSGTFTISWTAVADVDRYVLDESAYPDFRSFHTLYNGPLTGVTIYGYGQGDYYFRVRAEAVAASDGLVETSDYSNSVGLRIAPGTTFIRWEDALFKTDTLLAIQRSLLRLCAARGDLFAVLGLPRHFQANAAAAYAEDLRSALSGVLSVKIPDVDKGGALLDISILPLSYGEERSLSFGALYHPWMVYSEGQSTTLLTIPPDGCAAGVIAGRSFARGAWTAPANEKLRGVVGLQPVISPRDWLRLQEAHINLFRDEPQGFLALSANTLSSDPDWTLINVRRLISLLRRLALRYGPTFVFEPNSPSFRRHVQRFFSDLLGQMLTRGAFAGNTPESSFQVSVLASQQDMDAGRLIIELRVAPSVPMRFILVRLVQSGEQSAVSEAATFLTAAGG